MQQKAKFLRTVYSKRAEYQQQQLQLLQDKHAIIKQKTILEETKNRNDIFIIFTFAHLVSPARFPALQY